jgi:quercetin dioxygenase-like cupin family protein
MGVVQKPPLEIVDGSRLEPMPLVAPLPYQVLPYTTVTAVENFSPAPITSGDIPEGRARSLPDFEGIQAGVTVVGPGGGETWHTHLSYYDFVFYVLAGTARYTWTDNGRESSQEAKPGDFVFIRPGATHEWVNSGSDDLRLVWFGHFHNFKNS